MGLCWAAFTSADSGEMVGFPAVLRGNPSGGVPGGLLENTLHTVDMRSQHNLS